MVRSILSLSAWKTTQLTIPSMVLETGIFASQAIWLWRVRHIRREAKKAGLTYDQYMAKHPSKKLPRSDSQETVVDVEACHEPKQSDAYSEKPNAGLTNANCSTTQPCDPTPNIKLEQETLAKPPVAVLKPSASSS